MERRNGTKPVIWGLGICAALILAVTTVQLVQRWRENPASSSEPQVRDMRVTTTLENAAALDPNRDVRAIQKIVQQAAASFEQMRVGQKIGIADWQKLVLNRAGKGVDALRFRIPQGPRQNLYWAMILPQGKADVWQLCAAKGEMRGQLTRRDGTMEEFSNLPKTAPKPGTLVMQRMLGEPLEPGKDYLIWFHFTTTEPVELWTAITVRRQGNREWKVMDVLGLKQK